MIQAFKINPVLNKFIVIITDFKNPFWWKFFAGNVTFWATVYYSGCSIFPAAINTPINKVTTHIASINRYFH